MPQRDGKTSLDNVQGSHSFVNVSYVAYLIRNPQTNFYVCYDPLRNFLDVALDRGSCGHHSFTVRVYKEDSR